jgi:hypothetical protein
MARMKLSRLRRRSPLAICTNRIDLGLALSALALARGEPFAFAPGLELCNESVNMEKQGDQ